MVDGTLVLGVATGGTLTTKSWWENSLFAWILQCIRHSTYTNTTPADLTAKVLQGDLHSPLYVESEYEHTQEAAANSTRVFVRGSQYAITLTTSLFYSGEWAEFEAAGNCEVSAFSNADYYKKINLGLIETALTHEFATVESAEAATTGALAEPAAYSGTWKLLASIIVQNDGTIATAGDVKVIAQTDITPYGLSIPVGNIYTPFTMKISGSLIVCEMDVPFRIPFAMQSAYVTLVCQDTGSGGSNIIVNIKKNGTTIYADPADKPTITANTGTNQSVQSSDSVTFATGDLLSYHLESVATTSSGLSCTLFGIPS